MRNLFLAGLIVSSFSMAAQAEKKADALKESKESKKKVSKKAQVEEPEAELAKDAAESEAAAEQVVVKPKKEILPEAGLSLGSAKYPKSSYTRVALRGGLGFLLSEKLVAFSTAALRVGDEPQRVQDLSLDLGLRLLLTESFYGNLKSGLVVQRISWDKSDYMPAYSATAYAPFAGVGAGYAFKTSGNLHIVPELSYEFVPQASYNKELGGNKVYAPRHHHIEFGVTMWFY